MSEVNSDSQGVLCPEEAMSEAVLTATTNHPSAGNEVMDGSAKDAAYYHGPDIWPSQTQESSKK